MSRLEREILELKRMAALAGSYETRVADLVEQCQAAIAQVHEEDTHSVPVVTFAGVDILVSDVLLVLEIVAPEFDARRFKPRH